jgi:hypothetical protein
MYPQSCAHVVSLQSEIVDVGPVKVVVLDDWREDIFSISSAARILVHSEARWRFLRPTAQCRANPGDRQTCHRTT